MNRVLSASVLACVAIWSACGCRKAPHEEPNGIRRELIGAETRADADGEERARRDCERRMREVLAEPALKNIPALEPTRVRFFMKVKAEPVLFVRAPEYTDEGATLTVQGYREMLLSRANPFGIVTKILEESHGFPKQARAALLRDGYLYATDPQTGTWLANLVQPQDVFGQDRIWIQRGEQVLHAVRRGDRFYYTDGELEGQRARFILFDRAGATDEPGPPVHRDLRAARYRLHFDRMELRHLTERHIVANLKYGNWWVPSVLRTDGAHVELECEIMSPSLGADVRPFRERAARRERAVQSLRRIMLAEVDEALPFDEPIHEYGFQLDGTLRGRWIDAYSRGRQKYELHDDEYSVFDSKGRPLVPEVCVDFLTDTLERASGTWWAPRDEPRGRTTGKLDFDTMDEVDRVEMRRVPSFISFAKERPDAFDVLEDPERIELGEEDAFYGYLEEHSSDFARGDAVLIKGKTPWDRRYVHYHSFFVYESDPVTGMPIVILGNAGRPALRIWQTEARRTPKRAIVARIRFQTTWLEDIIAVKPLEGPPPLASGPD